MKQHISSQYTNQFKCDFCYADNPRWCYRAKEFVLVVGRTYHHFDSRWAACEECAKLIDADAADQLARRSIAFGEYPRATHVMLRLTQKTFLANRLGEKETIKPLPKKCNCPIEFWQDIPEGPYCAVCGGKVNDELP